ncbi:hypothetical protein BUALT_Bualt02G0078100 [Buddleja alternifolia]|uniref:UspA domain-containing protein n=1 Tax=Buddleja alternifolia TaxID=168488 RepID=A0AAV6XYF3_9LAMI|nr:hypothetical protein BUALT_Bualt02G0078100 [Buddleja alternifolia]
MERIVVVVEDVEVAKTALQWALDNILRCGDIITLLHIIYPTTSSSSSSSSSSTINKNHKKKKKQQLRSLRLKGFQLALSFKDICSNAFPNGNTKTEIVVTEGDDDEGGRIAAVVREIGASTLVLGLHDRSFLYRLVMSKNNITRNLKCRVLAIKEPTTLTSRSISLQDMDFSQIEIATLRMEKEALIFEGGGAVGYREGKKGSGSTETAAASSLMNVKNTNPKGGGLKLNIIESRLRTI